ncbi:MAG: NADH-quinone oxidoreductase subunit [Chloroflexota bacterium]|jgi:NADH-quinone oxidoreductase subunit L|nr:NADH-quinone oxidoreductase subunit [Chloroflexota bacterium]
MTTDQIFVTLLLALPLSGFALTALVGRRLHTRAWMIAVPVLIATWAIAMYLVYQTLFLHAFGDEGLHFTLYKWVPAGNFSIDFNFAVDALTAVVLIVVTSIGMLVHVYSIGYMAHDPGRWRFFAYLNLFMFSMLLLVLADNFMLLFAAWELVGLSSYLLIGFWYNRKSAALAAKKAFIVNRVGDFGFALGIAAVWTTVGTLNFTTTEAGPGVFQLLPQALESGAIAPWMMTGIALLLFMGAMGKSAQFPLHVWLPDAMEGPTPVSALIHAATMVNAGVYFVARANPIFAQTPDAMSLVAAVGIFTAILAASIALTQRDIKRVLAYSTLSQLGYMFAGLGVGAFAAAIFHLMTHGFFKGLLFLGSGSVIHAVHEEQDMNKMGGLWRKIPITHWTMLIGSIAIAGIPPLAGFFSKDEILASAYKNGFQTVWTIGVIVAVMTGLYMFRLMGKTFYGESHVDPHIEPKIHESPRSMTVPLILLAIPSVLLGLVIGWPPESGLLHQWLAPVFEHATETLELHEAPFVFAGIDATLLFIGAAAAALGVSFGIWFFGLFGFTQRQVTVERLTDTFRPLYTASFHKWWFDELNDLIFVRFGGFVARALWWFDVRVVDGTVNGIAALTQSTGRGIRQIQTGHVQNYALGIAAGLLVIAITYIFVVAR